MATANLVQHKNSKFDHVIYSGTISPVFACPPTKQQEECTPHISDFVVKKTKTILSAQSVLGVLNQFFVLCFGVNGDLSGSN